MKPQNDTVHLKNGTAIFKKMCSSFNSVIDNIAAQQFGIYESLYSLSWFGLAWVPSVSHSYCDLTSDLDTTSKMIKVLEEGKNSFSINTVFYLHPFGSGTLVLRDVVSRRLPLLSDVLMFSISNAFSALIFSALWNKRMR